MAAAPLYCVCRQPYDVNRFMIECDICKDWFHGSCVQVVEHHAADIDVYHCPNCEPIHGPSMMKKRNNWHRHDYTEPNDGTRPVQAGTAVFVQQLQARSFASGHEILVLMRGSQVTQRYLEREGFHYPIAVHDLYGLGLKLPPPSFSVSDVEHYVGANKVIDVIDVARQADSKLKLGEFVKYYYQPERPKVLNLISLEFSDTRMGDLVEVPEIVRKMSWVENYWPDDSFFPKPFVQKYCLMGMKNSYTDFHIDFGGTSVWYHVLWGEKIFYLIKPTKANLALYESWSSSPNQSEVFFGDKVDKCYKCVVKQGTTIFLPTGWIHAVLTSQDSMAFGGNFLHNLNIGMQLRSYEMERRLKTPDLFKFPYFEAICWYVAKNLLETLKELREDKCQAQGYLVDGVKALISSLKTWLRRELTQPNSEVPDHISPSRLIKALTKEIRYLEDESNKAGKSQGIAECSLSRTTLEKEYQAQRAARHLHHHHHHHHHSHKLPSNLDVLELHTLEVLKRLEVGPLEEDPAFSSKVNVKLKKVSSVSAVAVEGSNDNALRLVLCNGKIMRERLAISNVAAKVSGVEMLQYHQHEIKWERMSMCQQEKVKKEKREDELRVHCTIQKPVNHGLTVQTELRTESPHVTSSDSDSESEAEDSAEKHSESESSEEEGGGSKRDSGSFVEHLSGRQHGHHKQALKRERPTSPSTDDAIQGMLSMAGLLCQRASAGGDILQQHWWSSQGNSNSSSSSDSWDSSEPCSAARSPEGEDGSLEEEYSYRESSLSPPLHPSKRHTPNTTPISNQATKGKRPKKGQVTAKHRLGKILKMSHHKGLFL
ncbi:lysine-specific demethylase 7A-like isoform X1 [Sinocyclocheilus grahami]|uniref:Lysine-specific demethylase 7A-like n=1 Tax=Sinocyclocheilus grahami TaxID=75366 RepID=A0A672R9C3_SINGR|nr:PREDICTED: lysine-specific demethylase 7A-like isoform X1 [Sinocyclocheilus grahami]